MALERLKNMTVSDDSNDDLDKSTSESDEEQASPAAKTGRSSIAELISPRDFSTLLTTLTSTPNKNQGDEDTGKEENFNENTTDSGMGTSGIFTSDQTNTSECKILESNSSLRNSARNQQRRAMRIQVRMRTSMKKQQFQEWAPLVS